MGEAVVVVVMDKKEHHALLELAEVRTAEVVESIPTLDSVKEEQEL